MSTISLGDDDRHYSGEYFQIDLVLPKVKAMKKTSSASIRILGYLTVIVLFFSPCAFASKPQVQLQHLSVSQDSLLSAMIRRQLTDIHRQLYFPKSVMRFYAANDYRAVWLQPQSGTGPTWQAMLMLDCTLQFGLPHADYHPHELMYNKLHEILEKPGFISIAQQARFDIMLTDAMINLMNNLHFGKLNPYITTNQQDAQPTGGFDAPALLASALKQKDFLAVIGKVQPCSADYVALQQYMQLRVGQQSGDCYDVPDSEIRKMAINLNRLRWADLDQNSYVQINIPTYTLTLHEPDSTYYFKVIVGKPQNPTPQLNSEILYFTTSPEWKIPNQIFRKEILPKLVRTADYENLQYTIYSNNGEYVPADVTGLKKVMDAPQNYHATQSPGCENALGNIVFRFPNIYNVFLHDTPEKKLFVKTQRAFSHGCIRVERAEALADKLLSYDKQESKVITVRRAIAHQRTINFKLAKPVPIRLTYITCSVGEYGLVTYKDIYDLDNRFEMALYQSESQLAVQ
jgi:murein L,D-transpeptidase YcbB/YkuD